MRLGRQIMLMAKEQVFILTFNFSPISISHTLKCIQPILIPDNSDNTVSDTPWKTGFTQQWKADNSHSFLGVGSTQESLFIWKRHRLTFPGPQHGKLAFGRGMRRRTGFKLFLAFGLYSFTRTIMYMCLKDIESVKPNLFGIVTHPWIHQWIYSPPASPPPYFQLLDKNCHNCLPKGSLKPCPWLLVLYLKHSKYIYDLAG